MPRGGDLICMDTPPASRIHGTALCPAVIRMATPPPQPASCLALVLAPPGGAAERPPPGPGASGPSRTEPDPERNRTRNGARSRTEPVPEGTQTRHGQQARRCLSLTALSLSHGAVSHLALLALANHKLRIFRTPNAAGPADRARGSREPREERAERSGGTGRGAAAPGSAGERELRQRERRPEPRQRRERSAAQTGPARGSGSAALGAPGGAGPQGAGPAGSCGRVYADLCPPRGMPGPIPRQARAVPARPRARRGPGRFRAISAALGTFALGAPPHAAALSVSLHEPTVPRQRPPGGTGTSPLSPRCFPVPAVTAGTARDHPVPEAAPPSLPMFLYRFTCSTSICK
ncbi:laforin-like [Melozone crissalis]|uniref:laforin-like n=1 Tax=Melozone crissalis TaxID=40204 RepID=UPI0023DB6B95|nr:laforin-like [Melozone crissalis]